MRLHIDNLHKTIEAHVVSKTLKDVGLVVPKFINVLQDKNDGMQHS